MTRSNSDSFNAIGHRICLARQKKGLTQKDLALIMGITPIQIHRYECGLTRVSLERLGQIANGLGVPVSFFVTGVQIRPSKIKRLVVSFRKIPQPDIRKTLLAMIEELALK